MTSNKDLEERIDRIRKRLHDEVMERIEEGWITFKDSIIVAFLLVVLLGVIVMFVFINQPQYTTASPCELGLMEWEECCIKTNETSHMTLRDRYGDIKREWDAVIWNCKEECEHDKYGRFPEKSCPYSGSGIMVVKE